MTKIKTTLLTGLFIFGMLTGLKAQDKYQFAVVRQIGAIELEISIEGQALETQKILKTAKNYYDNSPLFEYISKLQQEGWEVVSSQETYALNTLQTTFFLRKKKN